MAAVLGLPLTLMGWFVQDPKRVENWAHSVSPSISRSLGFISSAIPFSLSEVLFYMLTIAIPISVFQTWKKNNSFVDFLAHSVVGGVILVELLGLFFYGVWGMNYARAPLSTRLGLETSSQTNSAELLRVGQELIALASQSYRASQGTDDLGRVTSLPALESLHDALELGFDALVPRLRLEAAMAAWRPMPKPIFASPIMARMNIVGFYSPFTGEANFLPTTPSYQLPHGIAHEKAHQRGIAPEDEANFIGFLVTSLSPDPYCRYSGYVFAFNQLYYQLASVDIKSAASLLEILPLGLVRDMEGGQEFWQGNRGKLGEISHKVNDAYLKVNGNEAGVETYNESIRLILAWERKFGTIEVAPFTEAP